MTKPIIGITVGKDSQAVTAGTRKVTTVVSPMAYNQSVERSGGSPLLIPPTTDASVVEAALERVDGLLISGGCDLRPSEYGEEPHPATESEDGIRDYTELTAARFAWKQGIPIFGICRGIQILNVALGGSLIQDIPSQVPNALAHNAPPKEPPIFHSVQILADSFLARILGVEEVTVNSTHHQSASRLGTGLRIAARSEDGVVEGVEAVDGRPVLAVQWHPERLYDKFPYSPKLFDWLVSEAAKRRDA